MTTVIVDKPAVKLVKTTSRSRMTPRRTPLDPTPLGLPILGVDPGYRYTGVIIRDGDVVIYASTFVRPAGMDDPAVWAVTVRDRILALATAWESRTGTILPVAVESVTAPKGFKDGKKAPLNPGPILFAGVVLGVVLGVWPRATVIQPGGNGSQHLSYYPTALQGRRPKDLPGTTSPATTRDHEKSAWDVAGRARRLIYPVAADTALRDKLRLA